MAAVRQTLSGQIGLVILEAVILHQGFSGDQITMGFEEHLIPVDPLPSLQLCPLPRWGSKHRDILPLLREY